MTDATASLTPSTDGLHRLDLEGAFTHPHWLPLVLDARRARTPIDLLDPIAMAATRPDKRDPRAPQLTSSEVRRLPDRQVELLDGLRT